MKKGTTLVEVLVAISIFVISSIVIGALFVSHSKLFKVQESVASLKLYKSLFAKHFRETGESAKAIIASYTFGGTLYTSSSSVIILQIPSIDASDNIIDKTYDYIVFYREGEELFMETSADALSQRKTIKQKVSDEVENLVFRYNTGIPSGANFISAYLYLKDGSNIDKINVSAYLRNAN